MRPALGDPAEVAKTLANEAKAGADVVRLVAGDPLSVDSVITEVNAVAKTLPPMIADRRMRMEAAVIVEVAHRLSTRLRRGDPLAERVELSALAKLGCVAIGIGRSVW